MNFTVTELLRPSAAFIVQASGTFGISFLATALCVLAQDYQRFLNITQVQIADTKETKVGKTRRKKTKATYKTQGILESCSSADEVMKDNIKGVSVKDFHQKIMSQPSQDM